MFILYLLYLLSTTLGKLYPHQGWGGTVNLNAASDSYCTIQNTQQSLLGKCQITCSVEGELSVLINSGSSTYYDFYQCHKQCQISSINVTTAYSSTPYNISITGSNFYSSGDYSCAIGNYYFAAYIVSTTQAICEYTSLPPGTYALSLSPNHATYTNSLQITVQVTPLILSITPAKSYYPATLSLNGKYLSTAFYCSFGSSKSQLYSITGTSASCDAPSNTVGSISLTIVDSQGISLSQVYQVNVISKISITSTYPALIFYNSLEVYVKGEIYGDLSCSFNSSNTISAEVISSDVLLCNTATLSDGTYTLGIVDSSGKTVSSNYLTVYKLTGSTTESSTLLSNGDVEINLVSNLNLGQNLYCKWGNNAGLLMNVISANLYMCSLSNVLDVGTWCLEISFDYGDSYSNSCKLEISRFRQGLLESINPEQVMLQGANITVHGFYLESGPSYSCIFNDGSTSQTVAASKNNFDLYCYSPSASSAGKQTLSIDQDLKTIAQFSVNYVNSANIVSASPNIISKSGSTQMSISGSNFQNYLYDGTETKCKWTLPSGNTYYTQIQYLSSSQINCYSPNIQAETDFSWSTVSVLNLDSSSSNDISLQIADPPALTTQIPNQIMEGYMMYLFLDGSGFINSDLLSVKISQNGNLVMTTAASWISDSLASFKIYLTISNFFLGSLSISASNNGQDFSNSLDIKYYPHPYLGKLQFEGSPFIGGDTLTVYGNGYIEELSCIFGDISVSATVKSYSSLQCITPYHSTGTVDFKLEMNNWIFDVNPLTFEFIDHIEYSLEPSQGKSSGGTTVTIVGSYSNILLSNSDIRCRFGSTYTVGTIVGNQITCTSPGGTGSIYVDIYVDGIIYSPLDGPSNSFLYTSYPSITGLSITKGPSRGNTPVVLQCSGCDNSYQWWCLFGEEWSIAAFISSSKVLCLAPSQLYGSDVSVSLSNNKVELASSSAKYTYYLDVQVTSGTSLSGPRTGGTLVTITGVSLDPAISCIFGDQSVSIASLSTHQLTCISPAYYPGGYVPFKLTGNGVGITDSSLKFYYFPDIMVTSISPNIIPSSGGTLVTINGANFFDGVYCKFGSTVSKAAYISSTQITCQAPKQLSGSEIVLNLSGDNQNFVDFKEITTLSIYSDPTISTISPTVVTENTIIKISGSGFIDTSNFICKIGGVSSPWRFLASNQFYCINPDLSTDQAEIDVSLNSQDFSKLYTVSNTYEPFVLYAKPFIGRTHGGASVSVITTNVINGPYISCLFEMYYPQYSGLTNQFIVSASYQDETTMICVSPQVNYPGTAKIRVSNDGQQWSNSYAAFYYIETCKDGMACSDNSITQCSKGKYCLEQAWYQEMSCAYGSYQDEIGQNTCKPCPYGSICPSQGMTTPSNCPDNKLCGGYELIYPTGDCPDGFSWSSTSRSFSICTEGIYCKAGSNSTCYDGFLCSMGSEEFYGQSSCPPGFYCTGNEIIPCPPRYYCSGGANTKPIACPVGTYNSLIGQRNCTACPIGYVCPHKALIRPQACPPGYICDTESLRFPEKLCTAGYYCSGSVETAFTSRPCYAITSKNAENSGYCGYNVMIGINDTDNYSSKLSQFSYTGTDLCCWNSTTTSEFILSSISSTSAFVDLASIITDEGLTGMDLYSVPSQSTTGIIGSYRALLDSSKYFSNIEDQALYDFYIYQVTTALAATICPAGVYCLSGTTTPVPSDSSSRSASVCNKGTYCEAGSSTPQGSGLCPVGYYCPEGTGSPIPADPGYEVTHTGNANESSCSPGFYTYTNQTSKCLSCPSGYECQNYGVVWPNICLESYYRNYEESNLCFECPLGTWSYELGLISIYECFPCPEGRICGDSPVFNSSNSETCLEGEVCDEAAPTANNQKCPGGFVCGSGTTPTTKYDSPCKSGFFCSEGTSKSNEYLFPCPDTAYCPPCTWDYIAFYENSSSASDTASSNYPPTMCPEGTGNDSNNGKQTLTDCIQQNAYSGKKYLIEINPVNESLVFNADYKVMNNSSSGQYYVFYLEPRQIALVTMDLRHISLADKYFSYSNDWAISFTISSTDSNLTDIDPVDMPLTFQNTNTDVTSVLEFTVMAWEPIYIRINILVYNGLFHSYTSMFVNSTSIEVFSPSRAKYGKKSDFVISVSSSIALPYNIPHIKSDNSMPDYLLTFAQSPKRAELYVQPTKSGVNWYTPNTLYWSYIGSTLVTPYFPYFSNCKGYGQYIPIWAAFELSKNCSLVSPNETSVVGMFDFGKSPVADSCLDVEIECIYDEVYQNPQANSRWFELSAEEVFFSISADALSDSDFSESKWPNSFIEIKTVNAVPSGYLPQTVELEILYQQIDTKTKVIITGTVAFKDLIKLTADQIAGTDQVGYTLVINYRALTHTELMNLFVFDVTFYLYLYLIIGSVSVFMGACLFLYHKVFTDVKPKPKFRFFSFLSMMIPSSVIGLFYAVIPLVLALSLISILQMGIFFSFKIGITGNDYKGEFGLFDTIQPSFYFNNKQDVYTTRQARCGVTFIICGVYLLTKCAQLYIPDENKDNDDIPEDLWGNFWDFIKWKRFHYIFWAFVEVTICVVLFQFSTSATFSNNIWTVIALIILFGKIFEEAGAKIFKDNLTAGPFAQSLGIMGQIITFGAENFVAFLQAYFVDCICNIFTRVYFDFVFEFVQDHIEDAQKKVKYVVSNVSDLKSLGTSQKSASSKEKTDIQHGSEIKEEAEEYDEELEQQVFEEYEPSSLTGSLGTSYYTYENIMPTPKEVSELPIELPPEQEVEPILEAYQNYANDSFINLYNMVFITIIWNFYDATQIAANYGISTSSFPLYFYFALMILPFQIIIDVLMHNANECFNGWAIHDFLDYMNTRFKNRKQVWALLDPQNDSAIEKENQRLYRLCFSSQFFFMCALFDTGMILSAIGINTILIYNSYNPFDDKALILIILFAWSICYFTEWICMKLGKYFRVWHIQNDENENGNDEKDNKAEETAEGGMENLMDMFQQLHPKENRNKIVPEIQNWNQVDIVKADDELIRRELNSEKVTDEEVREKFLKYNHLWLQDNLEGFLSEDDLIYHRGLLLTTFSKMFGPLPIAEKPKEFLELQDLPKVEIPYALPLITKNWLFRARRNRELMAQAAPIIESKREERCLYCGARFGIQSEMLESVEDLYLRFIAQESGAENTQANTWNVRNWQGYVNLNGHFRTICLNCIKLCEQFNIQSSNTKKKIPGRNVNFRNIPDRKNRIKKATRKIAEIWAAMARKRLNEP
ncbi:unnamed protein product [Blepharisma stoltei]|uniref:IPT/TIG domain-containing protein n=1 Tax=Blepharisma stoltei TaxID=1481888 RepID=A0AAU9IGG4_9CILI|nr:unnamed protein product [Blepharisma stoltei]